MSHAAVPILIKGSKATRTVPLVRESVERLVELLRVPTPQTQATTAQLHCTFTPSMFYKSNLRQVQSLQLTVLGTSPETFDDEDVYLCHMDGLPGAFPVTVAELKRYRRSLATKWGTETDEGEAVVPSSSAHELNLVVASAVVVGMKKGDPIGAGSVLRELEWSCRLRALSLAGMMNLATWGDKIDLRDVKPTFSYHCGGEHTVKEYFDVSPEMCSRFHPVARHGSKVLTPFGVAACVGVCAKNEDLDCPVMMWHPSGASAARLAPLFHSVPSLLVGEVAVEANGPSEGCVLLQHEELSRYLNVAEDPKGAVDNSVWLNQGLFGHKAGDVIALSPQLTVVGTVWNRARNALEQLAVDENGDTFPL